MKYSLSVFFFSMIVIACSPSKKETREESNPVLTKIAFGSCSRQNEPIQLWSEIANTSPDLFIFLGDNIYADTPHFDSLQAAYQIQKNHPDYQKLLDTTRIIGTWDDHDYGVNDGGKYFPYKDSSKVALLDFLEVPKTDPVWDHKGVYNSYFWSDGDKEIKFILLDTRYFRDTLEIDPDKNRRYLPNTTGDILGEEQWLWLENELTTSPADINIIGSSIQVIANQHGFEKWGNFPAARQRLFKLISRTNPANPIIISGDRHIAELSAKDIDGMALPLYDFTASGLTHTWQNAWKEENQYRIGELIIAKNFGLITIDWSSMKLTFEVITDENKSLYRHTINLH